MGDRIKRLGKVQQHDIYLTMGVQDRSPIVDHGDQLGLTREALLKAVLEMRYKMIRTEMTCNVLVNYVLHIFRNQRCQGYGTIALWPFLTIAVTLASFQAAGREPET